MSWNDLTPRWKDFFIQQLHITASMSKDVNTKVGSLIIDTKNKVVVSSGFNDLPRGVKHTLERNSRPLKYAYTVHSEQNSIYTALKLNRSVDGLTMIATLGCCTSCAAGIVQVGIKEFVCPTLDYNHYSCGENYKHSVAILSEGGVELIQDDSLVLGE